MNVAPNNVSGRVVNTVMGPAGDCEVHRRTFTSPDPVALHGLDRVRPLEQVEVADQAIGVGGDAHHPLPHVALEHGEVAAIAAAIRGDLFVGNDGAETGTPVDRRVADVGQAVALDGRVAFGSPSAHSTVGHPQSADYPIRTGRSSSSIGRARSASWSYHELKICRKIHCVQR